MVKSHVMSFPHASLPDIRIYSTASPLSAGLISSGQHVGKESMRTHLRMREGERERESISYKIRDMLCPTNLVTYFRDENPWKGDRDVVPITIDDHCQLQPWSLNDD